jgi:hypothetical protein
MEIAGHAVEVITRDSARVGCTKVTRAEAEALLAEMNKIPVSKPFLTPGPEYSEYVALTLSDKFTGWLAASKNANDAYYSTGTGFGDFKSVSLCLSNERARQVLDFLAEQLGLEVEKPGQKYIIEYRQKRSDDTWSEWRRSSNKGSSEEFNFLSVANEEARKQQSNLGPWYEYRARAI